MMKTQKQQEQLSLNFSWKHGNLEEFASEPSSIKSCDDFYFRGNFVESWWKLAETCSVVAKRVVILCFCVLVSGFCKGQVNLVPNYSFEVHDTCPNTIDQIHYATGWSKYSSNSIPDNTTPDYYNSCSSDTLMGVPKNAGGFQNAHRNCNAYVGLATFNIGYPNWREHIGVQLSSPLIIGQKYFLSFYTVMGGDILQGGYYYSMPSDKIGMRLSTIPFNDNAPAPIDNFAHLYLQTTLNDTLNWTRISGSIIADTAYQYLILGNFFDDVNTDTVHWNCPQCQNAFGYLLMDDICISTDSSLCNGGIDLIPCTTSIYEQTEDNGIVVFPNPANDEVTISFSDTRNYEVCLYDVFGKLFYKADLSGKLSLSINLQSYPSGMYFIKTIDTKNNRTNIRKIIKL
ncbi:MAG: T9SS type A sorting domain-containing protein [Bacteroidota bacterium]